MHKYEPNQKRATLKYHGGIAIRSSFWFCSSLTFLFADFTFNHSGCYEFFIYSSNRQILYIQGAQSWTGKLVDDDDTR